MKIDLPLFYLSPIPERGSHGIISGPEALHASKSRRLEIGDHLHLMDGKGTMGLARILDRSPRGNELRVQVEDSEHFPEETGPQLILASAIAKGDRQSTLLSMAVQAGMNQYVPIEYEHSVMHYTSKMQKRWDNVALQSCKQCRRPFTPSFRSPSTIEQLFEAKRDSVLSGSCLMIVGESEGESAHSLNIRNLHGYEEIILVIGPEAGFSNSEKQFLNDQKILKLCLSDHILRIETAAIAICAVVHQLIISTR